MNSARGMFASLFSLVLVSATGCGDGGDGSGKDGDGAGDGNGAINLGGDGDGNGSGDGSGNSNRVVGCNDLEVEFESLVPTVMILVDRSSSMFDQPLASHPNRWEPLKDALVGTDGIVEQLQGGIRFGFAAYTHQSGNGIGACPLMSATDIGLDNFDAIKAMYDSVSSDPRVGDDLSTKGETPTGAAVHAAAAQLAAYSEIGPKFLLVVTDGEPDTCAMPDPQCGQDEAIAAVQAAHAQGIGTFVIGVGEIGLEHLQDLANAGIGQPVQERNEPGSCVQGSFTSGSYSPTGGTATVFNPSDPATLKADIAGIVGSVRKCKYTMSADVEPDKAHLGTVLVNDEPVMLDDPNGWQMNSATELELLGTSCDAVKTTVNPDVYISFPCDVFVK